MRNSDDADNQGSSLVDCLYFLFYWKGLANTHGKPLLIQN